MDLTVYVDTLRRDLAAAAEAGGEEARALVERLAVPLESTIRLTLFDALSAAAAEITRELAPGSVDMRLRGREPSFVVTPPPANSISSGATQSGSQPAPAGAPPVAPPESDDGAISRINLRLPEHLKSRIEEAASREMLSVNAWLVRVAAAALEHTDHTRRRTPRSSGAGQNYTGWVR